VPRNKTGIGQVSIMAKLEKPRALLLDPKIKNNN
jgi:hypothetical protein